MTIFKECLGKLTDCAIVPNVVKKNVSFFDLNGDFSRLKNQEC